MDMTHPDAKPQGPLGIEVPSYLRKLSWAEDHLVRLEQSIAEFAGRHPYFTRRVEHRWILEFTEPADPRWPLVVGDVLYNVRSGLDHLAVALNPWSRRHDIYFPIVREAIWEITPAD